MCKCYLAPLRCHATRTGHGLMWSFWRVLRLARAHFHRRHQRVEASRYIASLLYCLGPLFLFTDFSDDA